MKGESVSSDFMLISSRKIARILTLMRVRYLNFRGKNISVGENTVISRKAIITLGRNNITIGDDTYIGPYAVLKAYGSDISIGSRCSVDHFCVFHGGTVIGDDVLIATHVVIAPGEHIYTDLDTPIIRQPTTHKGIRIESGTWLGANCIILDGAVVSKGCVVGAGSVVKGVLEENSIYAGVPAKKIKSRN